MDQVVLVVQAHGVHRQVDSEPEAELSLALSARRHLVLPSTEGIPGPGPAEIVLGIYDRVAILQLDTLEVGGPQNPPGLTGHEVEGLVEHVILGNALQRRPGKQALQRLPHRSIEAELSVGAVDQHHSAIGQVAAHVPDRFFGPIGLGRGPGPIQHRVGEQPTVVWSQLAGRQMDFDARPLGHLPQKPAQGGGSRRSRRAAELSDPKVRRARRTQERRTSRNRPQPTPRGGQKSTARSHGSEANHSLGAEHTRIPTDPWKSRRFRPTVPDDMRCFAGFFLSLLFVVGAPSVARAEAEAPTLLVLPAGALGDRATAIQLRIMGALRAAGGINLVHQKTLYRVEQRYEARLTSMDAAQRLQTLGRVVGADLVLESTLQREDDQARLQLRAVPVERGDEASAQAVTLSGKTWFEALDQVPERLPDLIAQTGRGTLAEAPEGPIVPVTDQADALLAYANCSDTLLRQPMGVRNPVVMDLPSIERAKQACAEALKLDRDFPDAVAATALAEAYLGNQNRAERLLARVKDVDAFIPTYWLAKFWVLSRYYDADLALKTLEQALERFPGFMLGRGYLGEALTALGRPDKALKVFETYLARSPRQSWVMGQIGYVHSKMGHVDRAVEWTERALRTTPSDPELLLQLASRFVDAERYPEAAVLLRRVISEGGARGEVHLRLGYAYMKMGKFNEAERQMQTAIDKADGPAEWRTRGRARYNLAQLWVEAGSPENALRQLRMAVREGFRDRRAIASPALAPVRKVDGYAELVRSKPRRGISPDFVSPLGGTTESGELAPRKAEDRPKVPKRILERF